MAPAPPTLEPELHYVIPTPHVPNSRLPIIIYRGVLKGFEYDDIIELMQRNGWKKGGQWKTYKTAHYHTNVHEGYAVISGSVRYLLGKGPTDEDSNEGGKNYGVEVSFEKDDVFILPVDVHLISTACIANGREGWCQSQLNRIGGRLRVYRLLCEGKFFRDSPRRWDAAILKRDRMHPSGT